MPSSSGAGKQLSHPKWLSRTLGNVSFQGPRMTAEPRSGDSRPGHPALSRKVLYIAIPRVPLCRCTQANSTTPCPSHLCQQPPTGLALPLPPLCSTPLKPSPEALSSPSLALSSRSGPPVPCRSKLTSARGEGRNLNPHSYGLLDYGRCFASSHLILTVTLEG